MVLVLGGIRALDLAFHLVWCQEHLLDIHLGIQLICCFYWHFKIPLAHRKNIWLEFYLER